MTAKELKEWRQKKGLSQTQLATLLGYKSYHTILRYETGKIPIPELVIFFVKNFKKNDV